MWNSLPQEQGQQTRTMGNSTSVLLKNLLPGLNYTVVVAAVTERLERFFEGNLSVPLTFTTMTGSKYIWLCTYVCAILMLVDVKPAYNSVHSIMLGECPVLLDIYINMLNFNTCTLTH